MTSRRLPVAIAMALAPLAGCTRPAPTVDGNPPPVALPVALPVPGAARPVSPPPVPAAIASIRAVPSPMRGVTIDSVANLPAIVEAVQGLSSKPTIRLVFDPGTTPADYASAVTALRPHAYLMGELVDSTALRRISVDGMTRQARNFARAFAGQIDIWEIGNEVNGAWAGRNPEEINAKVLAAYRVIAGEFHLRTAITLNYWSGPDCYAKPWEPTLAFAQGMPAELREGTRLVLLSVYGTACSPPQHPDAAALARTLNRLARLFPNARLGIGEIGAQGIVDGLPADPSLVEKQRIAQTYYGMQHELRLRVGNRFAGGYFWWYFRQDAVPRDKPETLWPELDRLLSGL